MPTPFSVYVRTAKILQQSEKKHNKQRDSVTKLAAKNVTTPYKSRLSMIQKGDSSQQDQHTPVSDTIRNYGSQNPRLRQIRHSYALPSVARRLPPTPSIALFGGNRVPFDIKGAKEDNDSHMEGVVMSQLTMPEFGSNSVSDSTNSQHSTSYPPFLNHSSNQGVSSNGSSQLNHPKSQFSASLAKASSTDSRPLRLSQISSSATSQFSFHQIPRAPSGTPIPETPIHQRRSWMSNTMPCRRSIFENPIIPRFRDIEQPPYHSQTLVPINAKDRATCSANLHPISATPAPTREVIFNDNRCEYMMSSPSEKLSVVSRNESDDVANKELHQLTEIHNIVTQATNQIETLAETVRDQRRHMDEIEAATLDFQNDHSETVVREQKRHMNEIEAVRNQHQIALNETAVREQKRHMDEMQAVKSEYRIELTETAAREQKRHMENLETALTESAVREQKRYMDAMEAVSSQYQIALTATAAREQKRHMEDLETASSHHRNKLTETLALEQKLHWEAMEAANLKNRTALTETSAREQRRHMEEMEAVSWQYQNSLETICATSKSDIHSVGAREIKSLSTSLTNHSVSLRIAEDDHRREAFEAEKSNFIFSVLPLLRDKARDIINAALDSELVITKVHDIMNSFKVSVIGQLKAESRKIFMLPAFTFGMEKQSVSQLPVASTPPSKILDNVILSMDSATKKRPSPVSIPVRRSKRLRTSAKASALKEIQNHCVTPYAQRNIERKSIDSYTKLPTTNSLSPRSVQITTNMTVDLERSNTEKGKQKFLEGDRRPRKLEMDLSASELGPRGNFRFTEPRSTNKAAVVPCTPKSKSKTSAVSEISYHPNRNRSKRRKAQNYQHHNVHKAIDDSFSFLDR